MTTPLKISWNQSKLAVSIAFSYFTNTICLTTNQL
uniref:Uncharacterized protein n=1 Tax=Rhizophora mucronata TaxID=61149 RepID=A0A2P2J0V1_RHIMU